MLDRDTTLILDPKYDAAGLITAVVVNRHGAPLMVAHMSAEATLLIEPGDPFAWGIRL